FPFSEVASVMRGMIQFAKPGSLWLHGTSIQNPRRFPPTPVLTDAGLAEKKVDAGFLHFMFGPTVKSMRGQSVVYGFPRPLTNPAWEEWLISLLRLEKPHVVKYSLDFHDELTTESQLIPMIMASLVSNLWLKQKPSLSEALSMAGPPCWLQAYGVLRNLSQPGLIASIAANHPNTGKVIEEAIGLLSTMAKAWEAGDEDVFLKLAHSGAAILPPKEMVKIRESTDWHVRLEGDLRGGAVCFKFSREKNTLGLLTRVLSVLEAEGLEKTSCMAQETPDGGCRFYIGFKLDVEDPRVRAASRKIAEEFGAEVLFTERD
ncbi:MAG: hypothetical protein HY446_01320, partial [Candidatus Niyogibacteria bacterium]|nr:hypothetical protein [Candidatus Niyogibacteria bacterium]